MPALPHLRTAAFWQATKDTVRACNATSDPANPGLVRLLDDIEAVPGCATDMNTRDLPPDCMENAPSSDILYRKLDEWGFEHMIIPHGNSEEFRSFQQAIQHEDGSLSCPPPQGDYVPCCWQAGEIMRGRCDSLSDDECGRRMELAKQYTVDAGTRYMGVFPDTGAQDWQQCGQCPDCFKAAFGHHSHT